jgi:hypothetical protein
VTITTSTIIFDIMGALQTLNATITGVVAPQPALYPTVIDTMGGQPFVMTWPGAGESWQKGAGYSQGRRTYRVMLFLDPVAQSDIPTHVVEGALLLQQFVNLYIRSTNTPLFNPGPYQATIESGPDGLHIPDDGLIPTLSFRGVPWFGFELPIPVRWQAAQL